MLNGEIHQPAYYKQPLENQRYPVLLTNDLRKATDHIRGLYSDDRKTYGSICASGSDHLKFVPVIPFGNRNQLPKPATAYFNYPKSRYYCKNLQFTATEFQTQGLELDCAIVHWDEELCWIGQNWIATMGYAIRTVLFYLKLVQVLRKYKIALVTLT